MGKTMIYRLERVNIASGFNITWRVRVGEETEPSSPLRARLKIWAWNYRQHSRGSVGAGATHDHGPGTLAGPVPADAVTVLSTSAQPTITMTSGAAAAIALTTDQLPAHEHDRVMAEGLAPNANLDITIDGVSYKTGLGDGTEKILVDELITDRVEKPGEHTIVFSCGANGAVEALLIIEY